MNILKKMKYYITENEIDSLHIEDISKKLCIFFEKRNIIPTNSNISNPFFIKESSRGALNIELNEDEATRVAFVLSLAFKKCTANAYHFKKSDNHIYDYVNFLKDNEIKINYKNLIFYLEPKNRINLNGECKNINKLNRELLYNFFK